jgi:phospholipid/cholesterol/gamma-HCH transport system substrate-binding protein
MSNMPKMSAEAKVGLLVIAGSVILLYMTFAVGKFQFGENKGYVLTAGFDSVAGIDEKASVRMAGVKIGTVEKVELEEGHAKVTMRIDPEVRIRRSTQVQIKTLGVLGDKYVEFTPVKVAASSGVNDYYRENDRVQASVSPSDVDKLVNQLSSIAEDVKQITASLRQVVGTEQGTRSMQDILADLRATMANMKEFTGTLREDGGDVIAQMRELIASLNTVVGENRDNLRVSMENIREASKNAETALASIDNAMKKIDRGEGTLGKLMTDDSMYNNINGAAKGLSDYVGRVEKMKTTVGFRGEYRFPDSQTWASLELKPRPDQYYIIEMTSDPFGKYSRTETTSSPPGGTVVTETYQEQFKFTVEFAKRWGNLAMRLGLIESTGGAGVDYYAMDDRLKFSLDSWNFNSKEPNNENAHVKATASYGLNKTLAVQAGYDNMLNSRRAMPFVGLGLKFDDDDLKYMLGSMPVGK